MNELDQSPVLLTSQTDEGEPAPTVVTTLAPTAGQLLHEARKAAGLSLEQLSARVKVPVARLHALEEDRLQDWPDSNVVRAVAASVSRQLRLDPAPVLELMPKAKQKALLLPAAQVAAGFRDSSGLKLRGSSGALRLLRMLTVVALGLAALGLLVVLAVPDLQSESDRTNDQRSIVETPQAATVQAEPVLPPDAGTADTRPEAPLVAASEPAFVASMQIGKSASSPVPSSASVTAPIVANTSSAPGLEPKAFEKRAPEPAVVPSVIAPVSRALISFKARGTTWIEVIDAKGTLLLRRTMEAGDTAAASGELPLSVVVGRADFTDVAVRGKAFVLEPLPDNVARFKVQ